MLAIVNAPHMDKQAPRYFNLKWKVWPRFDGTECIEFHPSQIPQHAPSTLSQWLCSLVVSARAHHPVFRNGHLMQATSWAVQLCKCISTAEHRLDALLCCGQDVQSINKTVEHVKQQSLSDFHCVCMWRVWWTCWFSHFVACHYWLF